MPPTYGCRRFKPSKLDHERVHRWTKNVDIFSKQLVIIPVNYSLHWSLIAVWFYLGSVPKVVIAHLDSKEGG